VTLVNFGLFDLLGLQLSPRIRDLGKITRYRTGSRAQVEAEFPHTGPLLTRKLNTDLIAEHYDDLLRVAGSLKFGHATASLLVGKLSASGRQNALAAALKEYGALRRTIYAARYLADPAYRRKISRQLNKGESLHALKRDLLYAHEGTVRARHIEAQTEQAWCLTLVTNAVVTWSTEYYGLAVDSMGAAGRRIDDEVLAHISPAHSENINFFGAIEVDIEGELAQLGPTGYRPLRVRDTLVLSRGPGDGSAYRPRCWGDGFATACGEAIWRCRPFSSRRRKTTPSCVGAAGGRYSRILPRTCGRWSPSEMPSVGNCLAISSAVRGPGWRCSCVTRRSGTQIAHTLLAHASASSATATPLPKQTASVAGGREGLPVRRQQRSGRAGHGCTASRARVRSRSGGWCSSPAEYAVPSPEPGVLSAGADRAPIRFPRCARLYV